MGEHRVLLPQAFSQSNYHRHLFYRHFISGDYFTFSSIKAMNFYWVCLFFHLFKKKLESTNINGRDTNPAGLGTLSSLQQKYKVFSTQYVFYLTISFTKRSSDHIQNCRNS